jgi:hypothetical protein
MAYPASYPLSTEGEGSGGQLQQAEVIQNHDNENIRNIGQGKARHREYKKLKLGGSQAYDRSNDDCHCSGSY